MKTLLILRHAKSDHGDASLADHDRPLNERGKHDAPKVGERLAAAGLVPDAILSSTAKRAKKTAEKVGEGAKFAGEIQLERDLYLAPPSIYLRVLSKLPDSVERALVVGHNPGMEQLVARLSGQPQEFPTAALAHIELDIGSWSELNDTVRGRLVDLWRPRELE